MRYLLVAALFVVAFSTPVQAASDKNCPIYVQMISKQLMHKIRLSQQVRDSVKVLRQQGIDRYKAGEACRPPLAQALRLLGVVLPKQSQRAPDRPRQTRRVHRLGS